MVCHSVRFRHTRFIEKPSIPYRNVPKISVFGSTILSFTLERPICTPPPYICVLPPLPPSRQAYKWTDLKDMFSGVAEIERADVTMDRSGRSKGFGVVRFFTTEAAQSAIDQFNGTELEGRTLTVKFDAYA